MFSNREMSLNDTLAHTTMGHLVAIISHSVAHAIQMEMAHNSG